MRRLIPLTLAVLCMLVAQADQAFAAGTAVGTVIYNTSTAAYTDVNLNSFASNSNTVTATVQNAPSLTVAAPGGKNVTPAMVVVDTFTLTNTGNAVGTFALSTDATFAGTATGTTLLGYVLGTCTIAIPCNLTNLNTQAGMLGVGINGTALVGVEYKVAVGAVNPATVIPTLSANITYALNGTAVAETSAAVTGTQPTDTVTIDARLDVQTSVVAPTSGGANIAWTVTANNGGANPALGLLSAQTVLGTGVIGVALFVPVPSFATGSALTAAPVPTVAGIGTATAAVWYNPSPCSAAPVSAWTTTYVNTSKCLAVYVSGGASGVELPSAPGGSSGAGTVGVTPQITLTFSTTQPTGTNSGNANSVNLLVSSAVGGTAWATTVTPITGRGVAIGTADAATASLLNTIQTNTTSSSGVTPPGGASNSSGSQAYTTGLGTVNNGPYLNSGVTGSYPGSPNLGAGTATNNFDFTALNVPCTGNGSAGVNGLACAVPAGIIVVNTVMNAGFSSDTITLTATPPAGWFVQLFPVTGCSATLATGFKGGSCTPGTAITTLSGNGTAISGTTPLASGAALDYEAVYTAASNSATVFTVYDTKITATGTTGGTADTNDTHNDLIPGGVVKLVNAQNVLTTNCPAGETAPPAGGASGLVCPGGTLVYTIAYSNIIPGTPTTTNLGTEPVFAVAACSTAAGSLVLTDDSAANPISSSGTLANGWGLANTFGIQSAAGDTTGGTVFTYFPAASTTFSASQVKLTAQIGGGSYVLGPGASGTVTFSVVVK